MAGLLSEEDLADFGPQDFHHRSSFVGTFEEALKLIDRYRWHGM
jgi:hypothetical protein